MTVLILVDTNVVIYSLDGRTPKKQARCAAWLNAMVATDSFIVSPQVCNEVYNVARRKIPAPIEVIRDAVDGLLRYCNAPLTGAETSLAMSLAERWRLHWWDAVLIASAINAGCTHVLTEDAQSSPTIEGIRIIDPFTTAPEDILRGG